MIRSFIKFVLAKSGYEQFGVLFGYLRASGWMKSLISKEAIDGNKEPIPWYTYSFIYFLKTKLHSYFQSGGEIKVFEFGSGNSTLWWAGKASCVVSVEDNDHWFSYVSQNKLENVIYKFASNQESYINALLTEDIQFDVIIIDGSYREDCIKECTSKLKDSGVLIVDNSDLEKLKTPLSSLEHQGFRQLEFYGVGPANGHPWGTSVFYRANNFLGI